MCFTTKKKLCLQHKCTYMFCYGAFSEEIQKTRLFRRVGLLAFHVRELTTWKSPRVIRAMGVELYLVPYVSIDKI